MDASILGQVRRAWAIAWPLMVSEVIYSVAWLVDTFYVSLLGDSAIAAVGVASYVSWVLYTLATTGFTGIMVVVAQARGAGSVGAAEKAVSSALTVTVAFSALLGAASIALAEYLASLVAGEGRASLLASGYIAVIAASLPLQSLMMSLDALFRGLGLTKPILVSSAIVGVANVVLDPAFIYGLGPIPGMGVSGAALATVASIALATIYLAVEARRVDFRLGFAAPSRDALPVLRIGVPASLERAVFALGHTSYLGVIARLGEEALAAHTIGVRLESIAYFPVFAFSTTASTMVGERVGAGSVDDAKRAGYVVAAISAVIMGLVGAVLVASGFIVPRLVLDSEEAELLALVYLVMAGVSEPLLGVSVALDGAVRGAGNSVVPLVVNVSSLYLVRVAPLMMALDLIEGLGPRAAGIAWFFMVLDVSARALAITLIYERGFYRLARRIVPRG